MNKKIFSKKIIAIVLTILAILSISMISLIVLANKNNIKDLEDVIVDSELIYDEVELEDSGITGDDITVDTNYNIYYTFLSDDEKKLYVQIYANIINLEEHFKPVVDTDIDTVLKVYQYVTYDYPELFWIDNGFSYKYNLDKKIRQITLKYNDLIDSYDENKKAVDDIVNDIVTNASTLENDYEKEKYVYNELIKKINYNKDADYNQTLYSALVNNETVCAGYSKAFQYIMNKLGVVTYYVTGSASDEAHAWNIIKLDGGYYNLDLTWNNGYGSYYYFNMTDKQFSKTHVRSSDSEQLPKCTITNYSNSTDSDIKVNNSTEKDQKKATTSADTSKTTATTTSTSTTSSSSNENNALSTGSNSSSQTNNTNSNSVESVGDDPIQTNTDDSYYKWGETVDVTSSDNNENYYEWGRRRNW